MAIDRSIKGKMSKVVIDPPSSWNPDDIPGWRSEQFGKMGFTGDLLEFLANSNIDIHRIEDMILLGATPLEAIRIEAGRDFNDDDPNFNHELFDILLAPEQSEETIPTDWEEEEPRSLSGIV